MCRTGDGNGSWDRFARGRADRQGSGRRPGCQSLLIRFVRPVRRHVMMAVWSGTDLKRPAGSARLSRGKQRMPGPQPYRLSRREPPLPVPFADHPRSVGQPWPYGTSVRHAEGCAALLPHRRPPWPAGQVPGSGCASPWRCRCRSCRVDCPPDRPPPCCRGSWPTGNLFGDLDRF